jgi:polysaccharide transporter, PST family
VSALSRLSRDSTQYKRYFLGALGVTAFLGMGLGADLFLVGKDVIRLLLGPKWGESGRIFTFFCPGIGVMLLYYTHGWIHLSIGRADRWLRWGFVEFSVTALLFVLGLPWGAVGIALAWTLSFWILTLPSLWYAGRPIQLGIPPVIAAVWKHILASLLAGCASKAIIPKLPSVGMGSGSVAAILHIVMVSVLFGTLYLVMVIFLHRGCAPLYQVARLLREMVPSGRFSRSSPPIVAPVPLNSTGATVAANPGTN